MPTIYTYVDAEVDVDIDVIEFVDSCSEKEMKELINYLTKEDYITGLAKDESNMTSGEIEFNNQISLLSDKYYQMTKEETDLIESLYNKYR